MCRGRDCYPRDIFGGASRVGFVDRCRGVSGVSVKYFVLFPANGWLRRPFVASPLHWRLRRPLPSESIWTLFVLSLERDLSNIATLFNSVRSPLPPSHPLLRPWGPS